MKVLLNVLPTLAILTMLPATATWAQDPNNWHRFDSPDPSAQQQGDVPPQTDPAYSAPNPGGVPDGQQQPPMQPPPTGQMQRDGYPHYPQFPAENRGQYYAPPAPVPAAVNIPAGKYINVRINNYLTTAHNQAGDGFTATLTEPLVVDGVVLARRGQTVNGRVVEADKGGRVKGTSSMRVELTELLLADGQQIPVKTTMVSRQAPSSVGRDAVGIGATTAVGAAIGAGVNGGVGAGVGAAAGLVVGVIGVLTTRGYPTVITPESLLTFRIEAPLTVSTVNSHGAFTMVSPRDYQQDRFAGPGPRPAYYGAYPPVYPYPYAYYGGPAFYFGSRWGYYRGYRRW